MKSENHSETCRQTQNGSAMNESEILQIGNANYGLQLQNGKNNFARIKTYGNNNGVAGDEISILQNGNTNTGLIEQGLLGNVNNNLASIQQEGDLNNSYISQEGGDNNIARIYSDGNNNGNNEDPVLVKQLGSNNKADVNQYGNYNAATIKQNGNGNEANISQEP